MDPEALVLENLKLICKFGLFSGYGLTTGKTVVSLVQIVILTAVRYLVLQQYTKQKWRYPVPGVKHLFFIYIHIQRRKTIHK